MEHEDVAEGRRAGAQGQGAPGEDSKIAAPPPARDQHGREPGHDALGRPASEVFPEAKCGSWSPGKIVSHSELACFRRCQREWAFRYSERVEPLVPAEALLKGRRVHEALRHWWNRDHSSPPKLLELPVLERAMLRGYSAFWQAPPAELTNIQVEQPIAVELDGVTVVGECDATAVDKNNWKPVVIEHKTTSSDISPGGSYFRQVVHVAPQPSIYLLAFPGATVLWDVLRKPALRQLEANSRRTEPESESDFEARLVSAMAEDPQKYFQRATVVRMEEEALETVRDIQLQASEMQRAPRMPHRNPDACWSFGRPCDFFAVCWEGSTLASPEYVRSDANHTELTAAKAGLT
jgi:hypothetical protein